MLSRRTKVIAAGAAAALLVIGAAVWRREPRPDLFVVRIPAAAEAHPVAGHPRLAAEAAPTAHAVMSHGNETDAEATVLPPAPNGDYEIAVSEREFESIVEARYGPLLRSLSLPPGATARLRELLTERQHAAIDVANEAMVAGLNPIRDLATITQAIALAESDVDADIEREYGATVRAACRDFEIARPERNTVNQLAGVLATTAEPLNPMQQQRLVQLLRNTSPSSAPVDINGAVFGGLSGRALINAQTIAAAAKELSPLQLDALRGLARVNPANRTATE